MAGRSRQLDLMSCSAGRFRSYFGTTPGSWSLGHSGLSARKTMVDTTGPVPYVDHPLTAFHYSADPLRISGRYYSNEVNKTGGREYESYNPPNRSGYGYCPTVTAVDFAYMRTKALANMNPSKPDVDLPVALFELREFPSMLRQLGRVLNGRTRATDVAGGYLAYSFGWAPLIGDVMKLFNLQELIDKRVQYLGRLSKKGGGRIKRSLSDATIRTETLQYQLSSGLPAPRQYVLDATRVITEQQKVWYVARAELKDPLPSGDALQQTALRAVLGLNLSAASLWEAIPWSWLIDYFVNIGDVLEANRGYIPYNVKSINIMAKSTVHDRLTSKQVLGGISVSGGDLMTVAKQRSVATNPIPMLAFRPFLTNHHYAIMGSLATVKALRALGAR